MMMMMMMGNMREKIVGKFVCCIADVVPATGGDGAWQPGV